jgi:AcrR family transcriptional regulator
MVRMRHEFGSLEEPGVLTPTVPLDIGARSHRQRIMGAMARSCAEKTFATTTIGDIVERASISRATFYKHFENKRQCFDAAAEDFVGELRSTAADASLDAEEGPAAVHRVAATMLERLSAKPAYAHLLLVEAPNVDLEIVRRYRRLTLDTIERSIKRSKRAGADPVIAFGRGQVLIASYVVAGRVEELPALLPELVYIALLPYLGQASALEQAQLAQ